MAPDLERAYRAARAARPTYPEVGATRERPLPGGYHLLRRRRRLGGGPRVFDRAAAAVLAWRGQRGAGLHVYPGGDAAEGGTVLLVPRPGGLRLPGPVIPCRVVWTADEPDRAGFAYGSLPGHPECGEESFTVLRDGTGTVWFEVTAFSRPAAWYTRLGGPVARGVQWLAAGRYLAAVAAAVREP
ncbi:MULTISPECIES: DUF1990 family protein [Streptomyces]|uniref:DUF1990 domain-containing protein n=1 Tax=Streptomyces lycii TaxID=2654337 RepID=A0ABQ7FI59_9ACTN|nr:MULTISPECIES: DUF1990 domain-containing protein [Streptomyces]KAF4408684.1 DUF1990 domain-containing protein [Streptomyces lycii]PGH47947.1 DUF1990 domain-containing protein [Streptomyces sp. Ru87]